MEIPVFNHDAVLAAVAPEEAIERVRQGFVEYASGEWSMPPKLYLDASPAGDFRAMPAKGAGLAILKWVTSFPGNPAYGLPVVMGVICVSSAEDGEPLALIDARAVTALRTGAVAAVAAQELGPEDASSGRHRRLRLQRKLGRALPGGRGVRPGRVLRRRSRGRRPAGRRAGLGGGQPRGRARLRPRHLRDLRRQPGGARLRPPPAPPPVDARRRRPRQGRGGDRGRHALPAVLRRVGAGVARRRAHRRRPGRPGVTRRT